MDEIDPTAPVNTGARIMSDTHTEASETPDGWAAYSVEDLIRETDECFAGLDQTPPETDLDLALAVWEACKMKIRETLADLTHQKDVMEQERDHARMQLQAIGRKAFWAAK
jgi:hypothetical protein